MDRFEFYEVGGCVRDSLLGISSKDIDYVVVPTQSYSNTHQGPTNCLTGQGNNAIEGMEPCGACSACRFFADMRVVLETQGYTIWQERPQFLTIRGKFPKGHALENVDADFVGARKEGPYSDGRRPDWVVPGTLEDDLARRDFTVNAIARTMDGEFIDPHDGRGDLSAGWLRFVGDPAQRLQEDPLRAYRGFRFEITKGMRLRSESVEAIGCLQYHDFAGVSTDRIRDELEKCFKHDTWKTLTALMDGPEFALLAAVAFEQRGLRLIPSMKER